MFFSTFGCGAHFNSKLRRNAGDRRGQRAYEFF